MATIKYSPPVIRMSFVLRLISCFIGSYITCASSQPAFQQVHVGNQEFVAQALPPASEISNTAGQQHWQNVQQPSMINYITALPPASEISNNAGLQHLQNVQQPSIVNYIKPPNWFLGPSQMSQSARLDNKVTAKFDTLPTKKKEVVKDVEGNKVVSKVRKAKKISKTEVEEEDEDEDVGADDNDDDYEEDGEDEDDENYSTDEMESPIRQQGLERQGIRPPRRRNQRPRFPPFPALVTTTYRYTVGNITG